MKERELRDLIADVKTGRLSRRTFVQRMIAVGLTAPMAGMMLSQSGVAMAATAIPYKPTKAGGGGPLKLLYWQAVTLLNPHFAVGTKDQEGSRIFYEPLAGWDGDGNLVPVLAAEVPSKENDGLTEDGLSVIWKLKRGVKWHDGTPFTADDVVFTWEYARNPETAAVTIASYRDVKVEKIDDFTVRVTFAKPTPFWADAFVSANGMIIPKHLFADYTGAKSRDAPTNLKPVGTGAFLFVDFKPGDTVLAKLNPDYHVPNRPYFDTLEVKGGGDAVSAARAVLQTAEYDYAWNMQVEDEILTKLENGGKGKVSIVATGNIEFMILNVTDPAVEVDGERSSIKTKHPLFSDPAVRQAVNLLIDRASIEKYIYGRTAVATANFLNNPERFRSKNTKFEFNIEKANEILEAAGWKKGTDGVRAKDGKALKFVFQTSINAPRQKTQAIVKQACQKAGIEIELKSVVGSVFFSSDTANPDTYTHFYCDAEMFTTTMLQPDPQIFMNQYLTAEVATKANKWQGRNISRWTSKEYDELYRQAERELDAVKRAAIYIKLNDMVVDDNYIQPVVYRPRVTALNGKLTAHLSGWDNDLWQLASWYREA
ncbi:MAG TPA: peptide ABC transporter substrate-binding protein [Bradyrhizobium sp.]|uniref:peptide ABC transporter substrate-binding protein n=1 Tax=Bradyrhizobium sp. TaxID=376 RepID=UPI002CAF8DB0|nr:peptide ABC transporter substrate-binding protein [Bradyrhizobium sp.]HTB02654.1 peptide ABC transporter substrate-binding protein [Bradyrhizobium sp.]